MEIPVVLKYSAMKKSQMVIAFIFCLFLNLPVAFSQDTKPTNEKAGLQV